LVHFVVTAIIHAVLTLLLSSCDEVGGCFSFLDLRHKKAHKAHNEEILCVPYVPFCG
jgi:hypothetical protein